MPKKNKTAKKKNKNVKNKSVKNIKKNVCSPVKKEKNSYTCYTSENLEKIKNLWNARHPDRTITSNDAREIWENLKENMKNVCSSEKCWLNQKFIDNNLSKELQAYTFAPSSPASWKKNPSEWLSSTDINNVMKQYEKKYKNFEFIGPSPIDFDKHMLYNECVWEELCKFELKNYIKRGKTKIGIVFNTDPHYLSGSHWISLFIDIKNKYIFYFDSNGHKIPPEINRLVKRIIKQSKTNPLNLNLKYRDNYKKRHQKEDSECGMYALYFIIMLLTEEKKPEYFNNKSIKISDSEMNKLRKKYFDI